MTRKRYVKLLMDRGCSRNQANASAREVISAGSSYQAAYDSSLDFVGMDEDAIALIYDFLQKMQSAVGKAARALVAGCEAFGEAVRRTLDEG